LTSECATTKSELQPEIKIRLRAQSNIAKVVLVPPIGGNLVDSALFFNQQVAVYLDNYDGSSFLCGTSTSIFTNFEFDCNNNKGYQVTV